MAVANRSGPDRPTRSRRTVLTALGSLAGLAGCTTLSDRRTERVTPAPVPSPNARTPGPDDGELAALDEGASLRLRNERASRRSLVVQVTLDKTVLFEASEEVLGGRGTTYEGVLPRTYGLTSDSPVTVALSTLDGRLRSERDVAVTGSTRLLVASLVRDGVEWTRLDS